MLQMLVCIVFLQEYVKVSVFWSRSLLNDEVRIFSFTQYSFQGYVCMCVCVCVYIYKIYWRLCFFGGCINFTSFFLFLHLDGVHPLQSWQEFYCCKVIFFVESSKAEMLDFLVLLTILARG